MKQNQILSALFLLAMGGAIGAQTTTVTPPPHKPASTTAKPAATTAKGSAGGTGAAKTGLMAAHTATTAKLPPGVPVVKGIIKPAFTLRYEDISIGTGADAAPNKLYKVNYTGYLGANGRDDDGRKFDSSFDHRAPLIGKDGKPELGDDGKPKLADPQPMTFPQGMGRLIPGFDQGFAGMKVGGKRRLFIPWQLAYGAAGRPGPDPAHPGIPPRADLIFDVELVDVADMPTQQRPPMPTPPPRPGTAAPQPGAPGQPGSGTTGTRKIPAQPRATTAPATPSQPAPPPAPPTTEAPPNTSAPATPTAPPEPK